MTRTFRSIAALACATLFTAGLALPAVAGGTTSLGHGVKCSWVLVSSVGGVNTYSYVCRRGV